MNNKELLQTPSQTVGPYFAYGLTPVQYRFDHASIFSGNMVDVDQEDFITINGQVLDAKSDPVNDAMIELWQNDGENALMGRFGTGTVEGNEFVFRTVKPKSVDGQAPFITAIVFMRGLLIHAYTRIYFEDESTLNANDEVLSSVPSDRKATLIAKKQEGRNYRFDIRMQGESETLFFEF
jgi:protocatechuate 3,4-dioxygenase alpha subunit